MIREEEDWYSAIQNLREHRWTGDSQTVLTCMGGWQTEQLIGLAPRSGSKQAPPLLQWVSLFRVCLPAWKCCVCWHSCPMASPASNMRYPSIIYWFILLKKYGIYLLCNVVLLSVAQWNEQLYVYIFPLPLGSPSHPPLPPTSVITEHRAGLPAL